MSKYLLEMQDVYKSFPGVKALQGVDLKLKRGEVLALVGENGAGKSTLINILGGIIPADRSKIRFEGNEVSINSIQESQNLGISIIHQELVLVPEITVAENLFLNREFKKGLLVDNDKMVEEAEKILKEFNVDISPGDRVSDLSIAQQQMVEIVKAISTNSKLICMDEPTSSLSEKEIKELFAHIKLLKEKGIGIIYISHRLSELKQIADQVLILRDGQSVGDYPVQEITNEKIISLMVGRNLDSFFVRDFSDSKNIILSVRDLTSEYVKNISFDLYRGEILGFSGLVGSGRSEMIRALLGFDTISSGTVILDGEKRVFKKPNQAFAAGFGYVPEDRRGESLFPVKTLSFNMTIQIIKNFIKGMHYEQSLEKQIVDEYLEKINILPRNPNVQIQHLSGGNQQKAIFARWLMTNPKIFILDEPTRGIDVGAKREIYNLMNEMSKTGISIIMISSEMPEIINMCDRVVVMREGKISKILDRSEICQENIMKHSVLI